MAKKILVVDDSPSVRTVARMALREHGYDVIEASNGKEALDMLNGERVHLVISDVNMPTMDGITFLKESKRHPNWLGRSVRAGCRRRVRACRGDRPRRGPARQGFDDQGARGASAKLQGSHRGAAGADHDTRG